MHIEIFSAKDSCEQGCKTCPLARKKKVIVAEHIDVEVQKTFTAVEAIMQRYGIVYDLHLGSKIHLFPDIKYVNGIRMIRFETSNTIGEGDNAERFSEEIKELLSSHSIFPRTIGFSLVPKSPIISDDEISTIGRILGGLDSWYTAPDTKYRGVQVTLRSNLIENSLFDEVAPRLLRTDSGVIADLVRSRAHLYYDWSARRPVFRIDEEVDMYYNEYRGSRGGNSLTVNNRVISGRSPVGDPKEWHTEQARGCLPGLASHCHIAIAPQGVMLNHKSIAINNPVLWMSHTDFRNAFAREVLKKGPRFKILNFFSLLFIQNIRMYRVANSDRQKQEFPIRTMDDVKMFFEAVRPHLDFKVHIERPPRKPKRVPWKPRK